MQYKKKNIKKKYIRKFFNIFIIFMVLYICFLKYNDVIFYSFPIKHIKIISEYNYVNKELVKKIIVINYSNINFFHTDIYKIKQKLQDIPWVYTVYIKRKWPDTLIIKITEQNAILQFGINKLINDKGDIFQPPINSFPKNLPIIICKKEKIISLFALYNKLLDIFKSLNLKITKLIFDENGYIEITLDDDSKIQFFEYNAIKSILQLEKFYNKIIINNNKKPKNIDLRYHNGMAIKW